MVVELSMIALLVLMLTTIRHRSRMMFALPLSRIHIPLMHHILILQLIIRIPFNLNSILSLIPVKPKLSIRSLKRAPFAIRKHMFQSPRLLYRWVLLFQYVLDSVFERCCAVI